MEERDLAAELAGELSPVDLGRNLRPIQLLGILRRDESDSGDLLRVLDVAAEYLEALLSVFRLFQPRPRPVLPLASRSARKVDRIPELGGDKLGRVEVRADHTSFALSQLLRGGIELPQNIRVLLRMIEIGTNLVPAHIKDVQQSAVPERLLIQADVGAFIEVYRYRHAPQRQVGLRPP